MAFYKLFITRLWSNTKGTVATNKETRSKQINVRITETEYSRFWELAELKGKKLSDLIREHLNRLADRELDS